MASYSVKYIFDFATNNLGAIAAAAAQAQALTGALTAAGGAMATFGNLAMVAGLAAGAGAAALVAGGIEAAASFEDSMANVRRVADLTRDEMLAYGKDALKISVLTGNTGENIASIMTVGAQQGLRGQEALAAFAETTAKVAVAWDDVSKEMAGTALAQLGLQFFGDKSPAETAAGIRDVADAVNELSNRSSFKAPELLKFFQRGGNKAAQIGLTAQQAAAYGGTALAVGVKSGELQGTRARMTFDRFVEATYKPTMTSKGMTALGASFKRLGISQSQWKGMMAQNPQDAILWLAEQTAGLDQFDRRRVLAGILDSRSADQFSTIAGNLNEYKRQLAIADDTYAARFSKDKGFMEWLRNSPYADMAPMLEKHGKVMSRYNSVEREFAKRSDTLVFAIKQREAAWREFRITLSQPLLPYLTSLNNWLAGLFQGMTDNLNQGGWVKSAIFGGLAAGAVALGASLLSVIGYLTGIQTRLGVLRAMGVLALKLTILAAGISALYWIYDNWGKLKEFAKDPIKFSVLFPDAPDWMKNSADWLAQHRSTYSDQWGHMYDRFGTSIYTPGARPSWLSWLPDERPKMNSTDGFAREFMDWGSRLSDIPQSMSVTTKVDPITFQPATITVHGTVDASGLARMQGSGSVQANDGRGTAMPDVGSGGGVSSPISGAPGSINDSRRF